MGDLQIVDEQRGESRVVRLIGKASMHEIDRLGLEMNRLAAGRPKYVVIDMSELSFMASLAVGQLVAVNKSLKMHGAKLVVAGLNADLCDVWSRCGLETLIPRFDTVELATSGVSKEGE